MNVLLRKIVFLCVFATAVTLLSAQQKTPEVQAAGSTATAESAGATAKPVAADRSPTLPRTDDPKEIVRRAVEADHREWELEPTYTWRERQVEKQLDKHGQPKSTEIRTYDVTYYYGREYSRLVEKNDQPLSAAERKKEDEKLEKFLGKLRDQSEEERAKHEAREKKDREEGRAFLRDMVNAYNFTLLGDETVNGVPAWVIQATPRKDFHPTQPHADILTKIKGKLWIEKKEYNWVRAEAETTDTIAWGLFLVRIHKGSRFTFQQLHLNDEVWLPEHLYVNGGARLALLKNEAMEWENTFSGYKKFATSSRILPGLKEVPADQEK